MDDMLLAHMHRRLHRCGAVRLRTLPMLSVGRRMPFVHPLSAAPSCLAPVCGPGASRVCSTLLWYIAVVP
jgi:hypothetical protein